MTRRWTIGIILALGTLVLGTLAASAAAQGSAGPPQPRGPAQEGREQRRSEFLDRVAQKLGVTPDRLREAIAETRSELGIGERLRQLRRDGEPGREGGPRAFGPRFFAPRDGERHGPGPFRAPGGRPGPVMAIVGRQLEVAASAIGMTPEQLRQELPGSSLEAVARAHGVSPQTVSAALEGHARERLNQAVAEGRLSEERARETSERIGEAIPRFMTREIPDFAALRERFREGRD